MSSINASVIQDSYANSATKEMIRIITVSANVSLDPFDTQPAVLGIQNFGAPKTAWVAETSGVGSAEVVISVAGLNPGGFTLFFHSAKNAAWGTNGSYDVCLLMQ